jgi:hypothetical protein
VELHFTLHTPKWQSNPEDHHTFDWKDLSKYVGGDLLGLHFYKDTLGKIWNGFGETQNVAPSEQPYLEHHHTLPFIEKKPSNYPLGIH